MVLFHWTRTAYASYVVTFTTLYTQILTTLVQTVRSFDSFGSGVDCSCCALNLDMQK